MIAVVTGGSGFIGQHLTRRLLANGHTVRCLVRAGGRAGTPPGATRHVVDFGSPSSLLASDALEGADVVFHLAGATKALDDEAFRRANVMPTRHLLGALVARRLNPRFVFVSSQAAAGPATSLQRPVDELDTPRPVEAYGRSKLEAERVVESFSDRVATTIVRPCAVYGPRDRDFLTLFRCAHRGFLPYPGTANHWLSLLHVDDAVAGIVAATRQHAMLRSYFLASESPVQWRAIGEQIAAAAGASARVRHVSLPAHLVRAAASVAGVVSRLTGRIGIANPHKAALARHPFWICSAERARRELDFVETRSLPEALGDTYLWYLRNGWLAERGRSRAASARAAEPPPD